MTKKKHDMVIENNHCGITSYYCFEADCARYCLAFGHYDIFEEGNNKEVE